MMKVKFDASQLGNKKLSTSDLYITFAAAAADMVYDPNGTQESINFTASKITYTEKGEEVSYATSKAYTLKEIADNGLQLNSATSLIGFLSYGSAEGIEKLAKGQPDFFNKSTPRYSIFEVSYNNNTGGADITNISQYGGSIKLSFMNGTTVQSEVGNTTSTTDMFNAFQVVADVFGDSQNAIYLDENGDFLRAIGTNVFPNGSEQNPYRKFNAYLKSLYASSNNGANSVVKKLTNLAPGANPGGQGAVGYKSESGATNVRPDTTYNLDYHFDAFLTQEEAPSAANPDGTYSVKLTGYMNATAAVPGADKNSFKYDGLEIHISADDLAGNNLYMTNFIYQAALTGTGIETLSTGWNELNADFGSANVDAAIKKKAAGDFAEGMTCGFPGSTTKSDTDTSKTLGESTSYEWWQNSQLAYSKAQPDEFYYSMFGNVVFMNSDGNNAGTTFSYGGVYGAPYDDRFGLNLIKPDANTTEMKITLLADGPLKPSSIN